jgi:hypothetical protein
VATRGVGIREATLGQVVNFFGLINGGLKCFKFLR